MKLRDILTILICGVLLLAFVLWFFPITGHSAIARAKAKELSPPNT